MYYYYPMIILLLNDSMGSLWVQSLGIPIRACNPLGRIVVQGHQRIDEGRAEIPDNAHDECDKCMEHHLSIYLSIYLYIVIYLESSAHTSGSF